MHLPSAIRVRLCPLNEENAYWKPLQGKPGVVTEVGPDELWDVVIACSPTNPAVVLGVKPDRFEIMDVAPTVDELPLRGWRGVFVAAIIGVVATAAVIATWYAVAHHL